MDKWTTEKKKDANFWKSIRTVEKDPTLTSFTTQPRKCLKQNGTSAEAHLPAVPNSDYKLSQTQQWKNAKARMDVCFCGMFSD